MSFDALKRALQPRDGNRPNNIFIVAAAAHPSVGHRLWLTLEERLLPFSHASFRYRLGLVLIARVTQHDAGRTTR